MKHAPDRVAPSLCRCRGIGQLGFTLVELLTVIAIIGILASILIPVVGKVREKARAAQCVSNQRQVGQALILYANDHQAQFPPLADANVGNSTWWTNRLVDGGYLPDGKWRDRAWGSMNVGVFVCPLVRDPSWYGGIAYSVAVATYGRSASLNKIADPARVSLVADAPLNLNSAGKESASPNIVNPNKTFWSGDRRVNRHSGGGYVTFVDGHVKLWPEDDLINNKHGVFNLAY